MTSQTSDRASGLLPHQIVAVGAHAPDGEKAFRAANATYRAIRLISELPSRITWRVVHTPGHAAIEKARPVSRS